MKEEIERPLVSVVIPAYKCEKYISEALDSVLRQTYPNLEIIVVNDCSPDESEAIIFKYMKRDGRIQYWRNKENLGVAGSRNKGVELSKGTYVAFLDSDDVWSLDKIEKQIGHLNKKQGYFCYASYRLVDEDGHDLNKVYLVPESVDYERLLHFNVINTSTALIRRDVLRMHPMKNDQVHEDYLEWLSILKAHGPAHGLTECLALYRQVYHSKSNNKFNSFWMTNQVYKLEGISYPRRFLYLLHYSVNGVKKYWI